MSPKTILIVEDDDVIRDVLQQILDYQGYPTVCAKDGKDALLKLERIEAPLLVVMDLMMPVMNGWELLAAFRASPRWLELPVIVLSAGGEAQELLDDPFVRFLKKPLRMQKLLELVQAFILETS